jgi:hypothetical protein
MDYAVENEVRAYFERAHNRASLHRVLGFLTRRCTDLLRLEDARRAAAARGEVYRGVRTVPVARIVGTAERPRDFDRAFRPRRADAASRWLSVARAYYEGRELPPVQLYQIGDAYYVADGHHRVSVARAFGRAFVDAEVVEIRSCAADCPTPARPDAARARRPRLELGVRWPIAPAPSPQPCACAAGCGL